ncbi:hypothetical protein [Microseira wollei]|uniref:Dockerin domain-containing protein n=1 Tax=Microseira wollei NIES-4236 TaxID=2530354 RepID=A0AAV3X9B0_9CYAN|nr:hypothetical protein [Microseira wollei]GET37226.1 hypothetical protein MiSe_19790 [Microseira wollei NIES-4236]
MKNNLWNELNDKQAETVAGGQDLMTKEISLYYNPSYSYNDLNKDGQINQVDVVLGLASGQFSYPPVEVSGKLLKDPYNSSIQLKQINDYGYAKDYVFTYQVAVNPSGNLRLV